MKDTIKVKAAKADSDPQIQEELAQTAVRLASYEDYLNQKEEYEVAEQSYNLKEFILEVSPDSVQEKAIEINTMED